MLQRWIVGSGLLAILLVMGGCATAKKTWKVLRDPSTPVGELRDQPSLVSLSMSALDNINPNLYRPVETEAAQEGVPYSVNLSGENLEDLSHQLRVTAEIVEKELRGKRDPAALAALKKDGDITVADSLPVEIQGDGTAREVGEYRVGPQTEAKPVEPATVRSLQNASPVLVKVIQLKDDSLFLAADFDALAADPEKSLGKNYLDHDEYIIRPGEFKFIRFFQVKPNTNYIAVVASYQDIDMFTWKAIHRIEPTGGKFPLLVSFTEHGVKIKSED